MPRSSATSKKQRSQTVKRRQTTRKKVSGFDRWLRQHPNRVIYGSLASAAIVGALSMMLVATTGAASTTPSSTGTTSTNTTPKVGATATAAAACNTARVQKLVNSVSSAKIKANLQELVQDNSKPKPNNLISRHVSSPGNKIKVNWAKKQMAAYKLQVIKGSYTSDGRKLDNVTARLTGKDKNTFYVVGSHIDSISEKEKTLAPGAEDDASGVIAMMEAGRVLKAWQPCMKTSIDFNGFNSEEEDLGGSKYYKKSMGSKKIKGMYNMDMIGYAPKKQCLKSATTKASRDKVMTQKIVDMNKKYKVGMDVAVDEYTDNEGDDLEPFWKAGIPGAYLIDCISNESPDNYPSYHKTSDTMKNVNITQVTKTTKLLVAALAELSMK